MFVRKKKNKNGTVSIHDKSSGKYKIECLWRKAYTMIPSLIGQTSLDFYSKETSNMIQSLREIQPYQVHVDGQETGQWLSYNTPHFQNHRIRLMNWTGIWITT